LLAVADKDVRCHGLTPLLEAGCLLMVSIVPDLCAAVTARGWHFQDTGRLRAGKTHTSAACRREYRRSGKSAALASPACACNRTYPAASAHWLFAPGSKNRA